LEWEVIVVATMTVKEWAEAYRRINEAELEDQKRRLPLLSPQDSVRRYLALCEFLVKLSPDAREAFAEERRQHYLDQEAALRKAALRFGYVVSI
jgi:hypothetical protein